jgi:carbonic anhydrase
MTGNGTLLVCGKGNMPSAISNSEKNPLDRRNFLHMSAGVCAITPLLPSSFFQLSASLSRSLTKQERDSMTPAQVIDELKKGNERFRAGKMTRRDYIAEQRSSAKGQYPAAVILGCLDSRVPAEIVFDTGIGDTFIGRVAGNIINDDMLGSMEFGCAASGAKVVVVLGHTACGAVKGAIDDVVLGNLTGLLARIKPAVAQTKYDGEKSSKNYAYVDAVGETNVRLAVAEIHRRSPILEDLSKKGSIAIAGAMYDLATGTVKFLA